MATGVRIHTNFQVGTLGAALLAEAGPSTIDFGTAPGFPTLTSGQYIAITLDPAGEENGPEIVHLTAYTSGQTTGTIERAQEGTSSVAHASGRKWTHDFTSTDVDESIDSRNGGREVVATNATAGATPAIDLKAGNVHDVTLTADATFTFPTPESGKAVAFTLILRQDATGGWTVTWPAAVVWDGGTAPSLTTTASAVAILTFLTVDAGTTWFGGLVGDAYA